MTYTRNSRGRSPSRFERSYNSRSKSSFRGQGKTRFQARRGASSTFNPSQLISEQNTPHVTVDSYIAKHTFSDFELAPLLKENIFQKGYETPTPIQDQVISVVLQGRDVIGIANTGTGKTAAFLIPLIEKAMRNRNNRILIVAPTRELAVQIDEEFYGFKKGMPLYSALCIGGQSMGRQIRDVRRNPQFIIGTPGRIKDLIREKYLDLSTFTTVVLDEADHMVDIGFFPDVKLIISHLSPVRQSLFFSATIDGKVREVLQVFVKNPVTVSVKTTTTATNVEQDVVRVKDKSKKIDVLHDLLIQKEFEKVLIFGRTKWGVQKLSDELVSRGFKAAAIHGNKNLNQRLRALDEFRNNTISILLATDVASRGLDIDNVTHVINYDLPSSQEDYVHRIGRTGRADKKGIALTFVD